MTTKVHLAADGAGHGLAVLLTPGQTNDSPLLPPLLDAVVVPCLEGGPPRRNPEVVIADRAYCAASNRTLLRRKRIRAVIPERRDQVANRKRKGRELRPTDGTAPSSVDSRVWWFRPRARAGFGFVALAQRGIGVDEVVECGLGAGVVEAAGVVEVEDTHAVGVSAPRVFDDPRLLDQAGTRASYLPELVQLSGFRMAIANGNRCRARSGTMAVWRLVERGDAIARSLMPVRTPNTGSSPATDPTAVSASHWQGFRGPTVRH
ncbi:transposase [Nocardia sp. SYP-A9097]|uniref:transposase n=1 Tax=Nocardia sp. SYP-A9097 TaxID=2663237 RepID=UPI001890DEF1